MVECPDLSYETSLYCGDLIPIAKEYYRYLDPTITLLAGASSSSAMLISALIMLVGQDDRSLRGIIVRRKIGTFQYEPTPEDLTAKNTIWFSGYLPNSDDKIAFVDDGVCEGGTIEAVYNFIAPRPFSQILLFTQFGNQLFCYEKFEDLVDKYNCQTIYVRGGKEFNIKENE